MANDFNMPIIPDKVMDDVRKGRDVPLEAFSEAAAEMRASSAARRAAPVHASQLTALSREAAREHVERSQRPGSLPLMPSTRRVIPEPFRRNRISAGSHGKTWHTVRASSINPGDMVKGVGLIEERTDRIRYKTHAEIVGHGEALDPVAVGTDCYFLNAGGDTHKCDSQSFVEVFRVPLSAGPES